MLNRTAIMKAAWALYRRHQRSSFNRDAFGSALAWAWHDAKLAKRNAELDARQAEQDRQHRAEWYAKPENQETCVLSAAEAVAFLPAHMSADRALADLKARTAATVAKPVDAAPLPVWRANGDLMSRLLRAQNHPANINQNITTFAAFFDTRDELLAHVEHYERRAAEYRTPTRRRVYA